MKFKRELSPVRAFILLKTYSIERASTHKIKSIYFIQTVLAMPYDNPIPGYNNNVCNTLRLYHLFNGSVKNPVNGLIVE